MTFTVGVQNSPEFKNSYTMEPMSQKRMSARISACWALLLCINIPCSPNAQVKPPSPIPNELLPYFHARTLMDFDTRELTEFMPELRNLEFAKSQDELPALLDRVGATVEAFFRDYPNTAAVEDVWQERQAPTGEIDQYLKKKYHYVITARSGMEELGLDEIRMNLRDELLDQEDLKRGYLLTTGHSSAPLYFHPRHRPACDFRLLGRANAPRQTIVIAFAQNPEKTQTWGTISLHEVEQPILEQGVIWIASDTFQIVRMRSDLLVKRPDIRLDQHTAVIDFAEVNFKTLPRSFWLPREVQIIVRFEGWRFQNRHRYSQYRLFSVESQDGPKKLVPHPR